MGLVNSARDPLEKMKHAFQPKKKCRCRRRRPSAVLKRILNTSIIVFLLVGRGKHTNLPNKSPSLQLHNFQSMMPINKLSITILVDL